MEVFYIFLIQIYMPLIKEAFLYFQIILYHLALLLYHHMDKDYYLLNYKTIQKHSKYLIK